MEKKLWEHLKYNKIATQVGQVSQENRPNFGHKCGWKKSNHLILIVCKRRLWVYQMLSKFFQCWRKEIGTGGYGAQCENLVDLKKCCKSGVRFFTCRHRLQYSREGAPPKTLFILSSLGCWLEIQIWIHVSVFSFRSLKQPQQIQPGKSQQTALGSSSPSFW